MEKFFTRPLPELSNDELFEVLDAASEEMKRRNTLLGPSLSDIRNQPVEKSVETFISALADLGVVIPKKA